MGKIEFFGWNVGTKKISFTELLRDKGNLSLSEAKNITDKVIVGTESIVLEFDEDSAKIILEESIKLGIKCRFV